MKKIITYNQLPTFIKTLKRDNQKLVLVGGCFDILHLGHVRFLTQAKKHGLLMVALESDETLVKFKGATRPIHLQTERAEVLAALEAVDAVILLPEFRSDADYLRLTQLISPEIIAITQGDTQRANKQKHIASVKGRIIEIPKIQTPSTTRLVKLLHLDV